MIKHIFNKELLEYFKSLRFTLGWLVLFVMIIGSVILLNADVSERIEQREKTLRDTAETIGEYGHLNRINAMIWPGKPVEKMEVFFRGLDNESENTSFFSDPFARLFPKVDLLYIATILLSLLAFIFTYDSLCGEKENGTLKLIHANNVSRGAVLIAKFLATMTAIMIPFVTVVLLATLLVSIISPVTLNGDIILNIAVFILAALFYTAFFVAAGLLVSGKVKHPGTSILVLLFTWVVFVIAVPNVSPLLASQISPIPSVNAVERELDIILNYDRDNMITQVLKSRIKEINDKYGLNVSPDFGYNAENLKKEGLSAEQTKSLFNDLNTLFQEIAQEVNKTQNAKADKIKAELKRKVDAQSSLAQNISLASPVSSLTYFTTDIASLGLRAEKYLNDEIDAYYSTFEKFSADRKKSEEKKIGRTIGYNEYIDLSGWPRFVHKEEDFGLRFSGVMLYLGHLALAALVAFLMAFMAYRKYDIR